MNRQTMLAIATAAERRFRGGEGLPLRMDCRSASRRRKRAILLLADRPRSPGNGPAATAALAKAQRGGDRLAMAVSAFAECLVGPARQGDQAVAVAEELFERLPIDVVVLDSRVARIAAQLRARHKTLRLPDALVIATAVQHAADELITTDRRWPSQRALNAELAITYL